MPNGENFKLPEQLSPIKHQLTNMHILINICFSTMENPATRVPQKEQSSMGKAPDSLFDRPAADDDHP
jgi:hypothetical protein